MTPFVKKTLLPAVVASLLCGCQKDAPAPVPVAAPDKGPGIVDRVKGMIWTSPEQKAAKAEADAREARERAAREESDRAVKQAEEKAAREQALARLRAADAQVAALANRFRAGFNGWDHFEGLTDQDPYDTFLGITYEQENFEEVMTVRSAGPDRQMGTPDDLIRTRRTPKPLAFYKGLDGWGWFVFLYALSVPLGLMLSTTYRHRRERVGKVRQGRPNPIFVALLSPIVVVVYGVMSVVILIGHMIGAATEGIDLPDFNFDFDLFD